MSLKAVVSNCPRVLRPLRFRLQLISPVELLDGIFGGVTGEVRRPLVRRPIGFASGGTKVIPTFLCEPRDPFQNSCRTQTQRQFTPR
jgi:hypothetical protein